MTAAASADLVDPGGGKHLIPSIENLVPCKFERKCFRNGCCSRTALKIDVYNVTKPSQLILMKAVT